jgi:molybdenum cofactor synthesis domain-containing protein
MEYHPKVYKAMLITLSDRASKGIYEDKSGALLRQVLSDFYTGLDRPITFTTRLIPDEAIILKENILEASNNGYDFIFTTGGTGIGPRDITPDVVKQLINKEIPGIMEFIRMKYGTQFPSALISRSIAGTIGNSLIFTLPGSPKAVKEYLDEILKSLEHCVRMINGIDKH